MDYASRMAKHYEWKARTTYEEDKRDMFFGISYRFRKFGVHDLCKRCCADGCHKQAACPGASFICPSYSPLMEKEK